MIIAIDGPAASGKGTLARLVAKHYGLRFLDTGALYRASARDYLAHGGDLDDIDEELAARAARELDASSLDDPALRADEIGSAASRIAPIAAVREALLDYQRDFARQPPGAVLDGRDIGTVVCPEADAKLFIEADVKVRARRRFLELRAKGEDVSEERILEDLRRRDERDRNRSDAPLVPADNALLLDTTNMDIEAAGMAAIRLIDGALKRGGKT
jgi:cytidylate kinase